MKILFTYIKNFFVIIFICLRTFLFGQSIIDTIPSDAVFTKNINGECSFFKENNTINKLSKAFIIEYNTECKSKPKRIIINTISDNYDTVFNIKNIITLELTSIFINEYKLVYERRIWHNDILKLEFDCKPITPTHGTWAFILWDYPSFIIFVPRRYLFSVEYQNLLGDLKNSFYSNRHSLYISYGLYYLNKSYGKIVYSHVLPEEELTINYIQSESSNSYGLRFLVGKKQKFGKISNTFNIVYDYYAGIGLCYRYDNITRYGKNRGRNTNIVLYNEPDVQVHNKLMPSFFVGLRFGIGWK